MDIPCGRESYCSVSSLINISVIIQIKEKTCQTLQHYAQLFHLKSSKPMVCHENDPKSIKSTTEWLKEESQRCDLNLIKVLWHDVKYKRDETVLYRLMVSNVI